jgi:tetratricopeptide (TPR) repeat protein
VSYELKPLTQKNLDSAMEMAKHYRDLNQPEEAESICRDILGVAPTHEGALRTLGLALTDRFPQSTSFFEEAIAVFGKLPGEYDRVYLTGVAWERWAKVQIATSPSNALHGYEEALEQFEKAEKLGHADRPEPLLRYNCCVRALTTRSELRAELKRRGQPTYEFGD